MADGDELTIIAATVPYGLAVSNVVARAPHTRRGPTTSGADAYAEDTADGVKKIDALVAD